MNNKTALVAGGSGLIGTHLLKLLLENYATVIALVRNNSLATHKNLKELVVDYDNLQLNKNALVADDIFCCLGTTVKKAGSQENFRKVDHDYPLALAELCKTNGASSYSIVTSLGADARSSVFYSRTKGEIENALKEVGFTRLNIYRPSILAGDRKEHRPAEEFGISFVKSLSFLLRGPLRQYRVIEAIDVAKVMAFHSQSSSLNAVRIFESPEIQEIADGMT